MWVMITTVPLLFCRLDKTVLIRTMRNTNYFFYYFHSGCGCSDTLIASSFFFLLFVISTRI